MCNKKRLLNTPNELYKNSKYISYLNVNKRWTKEEIHEIIQLKKSGLKLVTIGLKFNVTANAVRKALLRHDPMYIKKIKFQCQTETLNTTIDYVLNWGQENNIITKFGPYYYYNNNCLYSNTSCIILINKTRSKIGLPIFHVRI